MKKSLLLLGFGGLLASCGVSSDLRTSVSVPTVATEYRVGSINGPSVACDILKANDSAGTQIKTDTVVKAAFTSTGTLGRAQVRLVGVQDNKDNGFVATFEGSNLNREGTQYTVRFTADTSQSQFLPTDVRAQGIVVNPTQTTIRVVAVSETSRVGGANSGFRAAVTGYSDRGAATPEVFSTTVVPVYSQCTQTQDTGQTF